MLRKRKCTFFQTALNNQELQKSLFELKRVKKSYACDRGKTLQ